MAKLTKAQLKELRAALDEIETVSKVPPSEKAYWLGIASSNLAGFIVKHS